MCLLENDLFLILKGINRGLELSLNINGFVLVLVACHVIGCCFGEQ
jgi:hypothetical protein